MTSVSFISRFKGKSIEVKEKGLLSVPDEYINDTTLIRANFEKNAISSLPSSIISMSKKEEIMIAGLQYLNMAENKLCSLPQGFKELSLKQLILSMNCLRELPLECINPSQLSVLHVEGNSFTYLPKRILTFVHLVDFKFGWLSFCNPPIRDSLAHQPISSSSSELTLTSIFSDFSRNTGRIPAGLRCIDLIEKYSQEDYSLQVNSKGREEE